MQQEALIYFLLGVIQLIVAGMTGWVLLTVIKLLGRVIQMETKLDSFPIAQITNNRHRIEGLERGLDAVGQRVSAMEHQCARLHKDKD